eukprot:PhF_6_TR3885/c0_g1_i1/m.5488/K03007/RPB10, POLR2L; DNA-directed RNA polymerases I, II, and III subunit RPABC5
MIIPVRCFTCGKVVGNLWERYQSLLSQDLSEGEALDRLNLKRYCCRRMILAHVDNVDNFVAYSTPVTGTMPKRGSGAVRGGSPVPTQGGALASPTTPRTVSRAAQLGIS